MALLLIIFSPGGIADLRGRAEQIVAGEKGYFKLSSVVLQNVPVKYGACYYYACGEQVGTRRRLRLRELDEDGRGIHNVWTGSRCRLGVSCGKSRQGVSMEAGTGPLGI